MKIKNSISFLPTGNSESVEHTDAQINCFADVLKAVKSLTDHERHMITEVDICKLLLVNPATSVTGEQSFSMARRVKTWLCANMKQQRYNNVALLHSLKARTDKIRHFIYPPQSQKCCVVPEMRWTGCDQ